MSRARTDHDVLLVRAGRRAEAEQRQRIQASPATTITYTETLDDHRTLAISPEVQAILGYTQEEWMGQANWENMLHPEDRMRVIDACDFANTTRTTFCEEYRIFTKDGRIVRLRDEAVIVRGSHGQALCWQGIMTVIPNDADTS